MGLRKGQTIERGLSGEVLVKRRALSQEQLDAALAQQQQMVQAGQQRRIGELLVDMGFVDASAMTEVVAAQLGVPGYTGFPRPTQEAVAHIPRQFAEAQLALPVEVNGDVITIATADPGNPQLMEFIAQKTGKRVQPVFASEQTLRNLIGQSFGSLGILDSQVDAYESTMGVADTLTSAADLSSLAEDAPVVKIVNILLSEGLRERASDIHIEPQASRLRIRFRVDGALRDMKDLPLSLAPAIVSRIKVMAELDIIEKHRSQDGQVAVQVDGHDLDIRVNTTETIWGEKVVLRLLDRSRSYMGLGELGMPAEMITQFRPVVHIPFGMVVVAGPTGSGKTTTLYASINELDRVQRNITTIEDPVEYVFSDINQIPIKPAAGITFAHGLRAILRQDPDVVLIGEVRDEETAEIATQAALTGHAVYCSVHATDCVSAVSRFLDMGVEAYLLAPALEAVVSQRLVRRVCHGCAREYQAPVEEVILYEQVMGQRRETFWYGAGCEQCRGTGYYERVGIYEFMRVTDRVKEMIARHATQQELRATAIEEGMVPLVTAAMARVASNETTIQEVIRTVYAG